MGNHLLVPVAAVLLLAGALPAVAALRPRGAAVFVAACGVLAASEIVLISIVLSLVHGLRVAPMLGAQGAVAAVAIGWWLIVGRPLPPRPALPSLRAAALAHPAVALLAAAAGIVLALQFVVAVACVPNNWDAMTYHLARAAYWLQFHSALHFHAGTIRQLSYPANGELLQAWTLLVSGTDRLANLVQWFALVGVACAIYSGSRLLGFGRPAALFAASLFTVLPQPVLQATTAQNDLTVAFFIAAAVLFGARGLRDGRVADLALGGAALGLATGTKGTTLIVLPSLALLAGYAVWRLRPARATLVRAAAAAALGVALLGSFNYALNVGTYGGPLGPADDSVKRHSPVLANSVRVAWDLADLPGVQAGWLSLVLEKGWRHVFGDLRTARFPGFVVDSNVQEDVTTYGAVGMFILLPLLVVTLVRRRAPPAQRVLAGAALLYLAAFMVTKEWDPWVGRLLIPVVALAAPLFALLASRQWLRSATVIAAVVSLPPCVLVNAQKPLLVSGKAKTVFGMDRLEQQTIARRPVYAALRGLAAQVAPTQPIGLVRSGDSWDYSFFGRRLERRVVPLEPAEAGQGAIRRDRLAGIVYADIAPPPRLRALPLAAGYWFVPRRA